MKHEFLIDNTLKDLERHEGFRDKPYFDSRGVLTFGHGLTYITQEESLILAHRRLDGVYLKQLRRLFPKLDDLSPARQEVLLNMIYNLGYTGLSKFSRMRKAIDDGDFKGAHDEMLDSRWRTHVGARAVELAEKMRRG